MAGPVPELDARASACANRLREAEAVLLASHIDADGLTSAGIAASALERAGISFEATFAKQLDSEELERIAASDFETVLFTDFGSGQLDLIAAHENRGAFTPVICDHHQPADAGTDFHCNPLLEGLNGATELSGAGTAYLLARALEDGTDNRDLAALAVVGAVGDMQSSEGELVGANAAIVEEGCEAGILNTGTDLAIYGTQTRPLPKLLEYASDVAIPGISGDTNGTLRFLDDLDVDLREGGEWRRWVDLDDTEQRTVASALVRRAVASGVPSERIDGLIGTTYTLVGEQPGTELRDASEFSTLLNSTARYERADVGLAVCLGDRGRALEEARGLLGNHRRNLSAGLRWVEEIGVTRETNLQWFDAGDRIPETIVGIVAGMALGSDGVDPEVPIVAFAEKDEGTLKVSTRGTHALVGRGLDLSAVVGAAASAVGGDGGGHDVAAGATIPEDEREAFVARADRLVGEQLS
ncbi:single-stranded-DNA-specific exonuclease RecJ [Halalkalicoccus jeotgali]|uniref:Phosphoesterase DHHA1 n=1 Tax=Halalkalicoccus jeotgali (strain DSM 18796 / CECT 7217 / JCM 14584 / KCTC 4019 / B3) TaxID=795797 RepID=D8J4E2_HALJB|nr:DHH family phosphoesterase [Halalkalicoccus jeotgali]ADJ13504.1 phosphoesterase DHHA1 [Halalkalicoccus jeotgali B3]ELY33021.1 phosphoesterase DHHA1 [Halalkalicoccus jeotgali B3]